MDILPSGRTSDSVYRFDSCSFSATRDTRAFSGETLKRENIDEELERDSRAIFRSEILYGMAC